MLGYHSGVVDSDEDEGDEQDAGHDPRDEQPFHVEDAAGLAAIERLSVATQFINFELLRG